MNKNMNERGIFSHEGEERQGQVFGRNDGKKAIFTLARPDFFRLKFYSGEVIASQNGP